MNLQHHIYAAIKYHSNQSRYKKSFQSVTDNNIKSFSRILTEELQVTHKFTVPAHLRSKGKYMYSSQVQRINNTALVKKISEITFFKNDDSTYVSKNLLSTKQLRRQKMTQFTYTYLPGRFISDVLTTANKLHKQSIGTWKHSPKVSELKKAYNCSYTNFKKLQKQNLLHKIEVSKFFDLVNGYTIESVLNPDHTENQDYFGINALTKSVVYIDSRNVYFKITNEEELFGDRMDGLGRNYGLFNKVSKSLRKELLNDYYEYDMESGVYSVMFNIMYSTLYSAGNNNRVEASIFYKNMKEEFPLLYRLMTNKKLFRAQMAGRMRISQESVKTLMTALAYNKNFNVYDFIQKNCLFDFTSYRAFMEKKDLKLVDDLIKEVKKLTERAHTVIYSENTNEFATIAGVSIKNIRKLVEEDIETSRVKKPQLFGRGRSIKSKQLYRMYEIIENRIRNTVMKGVSSHIQLHDCIFSENEYNTRDITRYVYKHLGLLINFSKEKISPT